MKKISLYALIILVLISFVSCSSSKSLFSFGKKNKAEVDTTAAAVQSVEDNTSVEVVSDEVPYNSLGLVYGVGNKSAVVISSYAIKGESEEGDFFDWIQATSNEIVLSNITKGHWNLEIRALDKDGNVLQISRVKTEFGGDNSSDMDLERINYEGQGDVKVQYNWRASKIVNPSMEIYVKGLDDDTYTKRPDSEVTISPNGAVWNAGPFDCGKYIVKAILKDNGYVIGGAGSTMRIYPSLTSVGSVEILTNEFSPAFNLFDLLPSSMADVNGSIVITSDSLTCTGDFVSNNVSFAWFIDGKEIENDSESLNLEKMGIKEEGNYRIDCIVYKDDIVFTNFQALVYFDGETLEGMLISDFYSPSTGELE